LVFAPASISPAPPTPILAAEALSVVQNLICAPAPVSREILFSFPPALPDIPRWSGQATLESEMIN
jgi:hypothetical protein